MVRGSSIKQIYKLIYGAEFWVWNSVFSLLGRRSIDKCNRRHLGWCVVRCKQMNWRQQRRIDYHDWWQRHPARRVYSRGYLDWHNIGYFSTSGTLISSATTNTITGLGTITSGVWHGTKIDLAYGGANADLSATGGSCADADQCGGSNYRSAVGRVQSQQ